MAMERAYVQLEPERLAPGAWVPLRSPAPQANPARAKNPVGPEIAFLSHYGVPPGLLLKADRIAASLGVSAEQALLAENFPEDVFYRLLARHLHVPYLDQPMRLVLEPGRSPEATGSGAYQLAPNDRGLEQVLAPKGAELRSLLQQMERGRARDARFAICSPRCLEALVRHHDQAGLLMRATHGLGNWNMGFSAQAGLTRGQKIFALALAVCTGVGFGMMPRAAALAASVAFALLFLGSVLLRLMATATSRRSAALGSREDAASSPIGEHALPVYTIVVPLYREIGVLDRLITALDALDYPRAKLDIKIMLEAHDHATIAALAERCLPARYDIIVVPPGEPRTKPRALNVALHFARGALLTVFDAEDRPEPQQLRKAVARFAALPDAVACLQARLACDHSKHNWLSRMFSLEYAGLFHAVMPGLAALRLPVPLGGTSNHFRVDMLHRVGGWDAWNVTEDIDLGFRLARFRLHVESLDSTTFEEAPLTVKAWLYQRRRWLKGWMITLLVHTRHPRRLLRDAGLCGAGAISLALLGTVLGCLFGPFFVAIMIGEAVTGTLFGALRPIAVAWTLGCLSLTLLGLLSAFWPICVGSRRQGMALKAIWLWTYPFYLVMVSIAAWLALFEALVNPFGWNKTEHGLAERSSSPF